MSRYSKILNSNITIFFGSDHALGFFFDITDERYANSSLYKKGEEFVFEYSKCFGIGINKIGLKESDFIDRDRKYIDLKVIELCDKFCIENKL